MSLLTINKGTIFVGTADEFSTLFNATDKKIDKDCIFFILGPDAKQEDRQKAYETAVKQGISGG